MEVANVAVRVAVARLEDDAVVAVSDIDLEEYLALAVEAGGGAVAVGCVADFHLEGEATLVVAGDTKFPELVTVAESPEGLRAKFADEEELVLDELGGTQAVAALAPRGGNPDASWFLLSKSLVPPASLDIELKPLAEAGDGFRLGVVGEDAGVDDGIVGAWEHVVRAFALRRRHAPDVGDGTFVIAGDFAEDFAHVAVLANDALGGGGTGAELL